MKYYIIAGEASGDLHGSNLIKALFKEDPHATIRCWGGDLMQAAGGTLVKHYKELAFMGFIEVFTHLLTIFKNNLFCKRDIEKFNPDALVFIDYSGFNLPIAKWAKKKGFQTNYYISPQVWASRAYRIKAIKRDVDAMYVILPFEKDFYEKQYQYPVQFVGHPLLDSIADKPPVEEAAFRKEHQLGNKEIIALLPGSRKQEIKKMLSVMLSVVERFPQYQFVIAGAPSQKYAFYQSFIGAKPVLFVQNQTYDLLRISKAALVASGTATLETALLKVPQVVCYKGSWVSYQIAKRIITLKFISLVNLILDKEAVTELIQEDVTREKIETELGNLLRNSYREKMLLEYQRLERLLGGQGASKNTAKSIVKRLL